MCLKRNVSGILRSSLIYEESLTLICQLIQFCLYGVHEQMLLSGAGYINDLKVHHNNQKQVNYVNILHCPANNAHFVFNKVCRKSSGLMRHMVSTQESCRLHRSNQRV